jgi:hypothetical protein
MVHIVFFFGWVVIGENRGEERELMGGIKKLIEIEDAKK